MDALEVDPRFEMAMDMLRDLRCAAMDSNNMNNRMDNACDVNDKGLENEVSIFTHSVTGYGCGYGYGYDHVIVERMHSKTIGTVTDIEQCRYVEKKN